MSKEPILSSDPKIAQVLKLLGVEPQGLVDIDIFIRAGEVVSLVEKRVAMAATDGATEKSKGSA